MDARLDIGNGFSVSLDAPAQTCGIHGVPTIDARCVECDAVAREITIDGLGYRTEVTPINSTYGVEGVYVSFYPVDRPREYGEYYALHKTEDGWEYIGAGKIRVSGNEPYGWILATAKPHNIAFLVKLANGENPEAS